MRASGLLLPVFSLPGKYGIGCFSGEAYRFVDFLKEAGQKYWQILPVGPTGYGDSPYQSFSAFAGNPYFISPDTLVREGLLTQEEAAEAVYDGDPSSVDYAWLYQTREKLLRKAFERQKNKINLQKDCGKTEDSREAAAGKTPEAAGKTAGRLLVDAGKAAGNATRNVGKTVEKPLEEARRPAAFPGQNTSGEEKVHPEEPEQAWLQDYALFMALKKAHGGAGFRSWEEPLRMRHPAALEKARRELADEIAFQVFLQETFEQQWMDLKAYANGQGISIIGDIPIYVPADSAEVWACPDLFQLREDGSCKAVAGCPPDGFSATGQLWGNPLYDWDHHARTGYAWWISRMRRCSRLFDIVRIDHFRGFDQYYAIPADSADARIGRWEDGPGIRLFQAIEREIPGLNIIAEDLGYITESVRQLVRDTGYPNMKVLEFAFDSRDSSGKDAYLPYHYDKNCVVYTGTHDNETLVGWLDHILPEERDQVRAFVGLDGKTGDQWAYDAPDTPGTAAKSRPAACGDQVPAIESPDRSEARPVAYGDQVPAMESVERPEAPMQETLRLARAMVRSAMASVGNLCVIPMQDWLLLGEKARINTPSTTGSNWTWRMEEGAASTELAAQIRLMTRTYGRA